MQKARNIHNVDRNTRNANLPRGDGFRYLEQGTRNGSRSKLKDDINKRHISNGKHIHTSGVERLSVLTPGKTNSHV